MMSIELNPRTHKYNTFSRECKQRLWIKTAGAGGGEAQVLRNRRPSQEESRCYGGTIMY